MLLLGQLIDVLDDNERVIIRSAHERSLTYIDDIRLSEAKTLLTKDSRTLPVNCIFSDTSERYKGETVTIIYVKSNGLLILKE